MVKDRASSFILGIAGIVPATDPQSARPGDASSPGVCIIIQQAPAAIDQPMQPVITVEPAPTPPRFDEIITP